MPRPSLSCNVTLATLFALWGAQQAVQAVLPAESAALLPYITPLAAFLNSVVVGKMMDKHNKPGETADELLRNGYLSRAVGRAIQAVTQKMANEAEWKRDAKSLHAFANALPKSWETLLLTPDAKPSLARLQDTELPDILSEASGKNPEPPFLTAAQWKEIAGELAKAAKPALSDPVLDALAERLTAGFIHALRQVLTTDNDESAKAFRRLTLDFFAGIQKDIAVIGETTKRTEKNTQALLTDTGDLLLQNEAIKANTDRIVAMLEKELAVKNDQISFLMNQISQRPVPSPQAVALAEQIPADAGNYALALKATAESRYDDAERLYRAVEEDQEIEMARVYNSHATNEFFALRYNDAVKYAKKAAALRPDDADYQGELDYYLHATGRFSEALAPSIAALKIREASLGPKHPDTATSLNNLALLYQAQGKWDEAEPLYVRALAIREDVLGPKHPDTAGSLNNLGFLRFNQDNIPEAEQLLRRACEIWEAVLGLAHPNTAVTLRNIEGVLDAQGKTDEAEPFRRRAEESEAAFRQLNRESSGGNRDT